MATAATWVIGELRQSITRRPEAVNANWRSEVLFRLSIGVGALGAGVLARVTPSATIRTTAVAESVGLVLFWSGISLRLWSFHTLGRYFTFTVQTSNDQPVIVDGPYRVIRHPGYAGLLLVIIAVGLFIGNWWSLVCLTGAITSRARVPHSSRGARTHPEPRRPLSQLRGNAQTAGALHLVTTSAPNCRAPLYTARQVSPWADWPPQDGAARVGPPRTTF